MTAAFVLIFHRFWTGAIFFRDSFRLYAPIKMLVAAGWGSGRVMAWNPYQYLGVPFIGDVLTGYFYPLNVIYLLLPFAYAHTWFILIHYPLAAIFMDLFLRGEGIDRRASLFGGLAFALCGYLTCQHENLVFLIGAAWAPLALYCFSRSLRESGAVWASAAGAVLAMQVFGGDPQSAAVTAALMFFWGAGTMIAGPGSEGNAGRRRRLHVFPLLAILIAGLMSFALCAVQLFPTYELMTHSPRAGGIALKDSSMFSYHPAGLIDLIWPTPFGVLWPKFHFWGKFLLDSPANNPWSITNYLGLPALCLAGVGLVRGGRRLRWGAGAAGAFFLLLSFGHNAPIYGWCHAQVPLFSLFRYPGKYMAWFSGAMAVLAALGLERVLMLIEARPAALRRGAWIYLAVAALGSALAVFLWPPALRGLMGLTPGLDAQLYDFAVFHLEATGLQFALVNAAAGIIGVLAARRIPSLRRGYWLFILLCVLDWSLADVSAMPSAPYRIYTFHPVASGLISPEGRPEPGRYRIYREDMPFTRASSGDMNLPGLAGQIAWERSVLMPNFDNMEGFEDVQGYNAAIPAEGEALLNHDLGPRLLELFNTRYIIAPFRYVPETTEGIEQAGSDRDSDVTVFRLTGAFPRAYWVPAARRAADEKEATALLNSVELDKYVIITGGETVDGGPSGRSLTGVKVLSYGPDRVRIATDVDRAGWLVLSDRMYPGWEATVDGSPARINIANVLCRAVRLAAGPHQVEFRFRPESLRRGALISVPAWIAAIGWWAAALWMRRKKEYSGPTGA